MLMLQISIFGDFYLFHVIVIDAQKNYLSATFFFQQIK